MYVRLLGGIEVRIEADGSPVALGGPTQRRLFAYLADRANTVVPIGRLVDITWPDDNAPDRAEHNVRTYIHRLRQSLGEHGKRLETLPVGYRLQVEDDEVDMSRFVEATEAARRHRELGSASDASDHVAVALSVWSGSPFDEFAEETWAVGARTRLDALYVSIRELQAELYLETSQADAALVELQDLTSDYPLHEGPQRLLMMALSAAGQRADALRSFQTFRTRLLDDVGIEPSAGLYELDQSIASGESVEPSPTFAGSYELHECIGGGASALVYRAIQRSLDREVAVKVIRSSLASKPEFIRRFEGEARMIARVNDPGVVPLHDFWRDTDRAYLVMQYMPGGTLQSKIEEAPLTVENVVTLVDSIGRALDAAHAVGVVHRDIKPANVLYDSAGMPALADFGIAIDLAADNETLHPSSHSTPISPEQVRNEPIGPPSDIHGLGVLAYTALAGQSPFEHADPLALRELWGRQQIPSLEPLGFSAQVDRVLRTATASTPSDRYTSGAAFAAELRAAFEQPSAPANQPDLPNPYRGLEPFTEADASHFFGRRSLVAELIGKLEQGSRLLAIIGPSGSGKSSVARAGVVPQLRSGVVEGSESWFITTMTPSSDPFHSLVTSLERIAVAPTTGAADRLRSKKVSLDDLLTSLLPDLDGTLVVLIDQFEELYSRCTPSDAETFLAAISSVLASEEVDVRVVATLRADFYDRPLRHAEFARHLRDGATAVTPMTPAELHEAIVGPAASVGVELEDGLAAELVAEVSDQADSLPMLQFALYELFERRENNTMTVAAHRKIGGVSGSIGAHAEALYASADAERKADYQDVMTRLVAVNDSGEPTSHRRSSSDIGLNHSTTEALSELTNARLLSAGVDPSTREPTIGLAHEALISQWPRLADWIDNDRSMLRTLRRLRLAANTWHAEANADSDLYRGVRLDAAADLLAAQPHRLTTDETEFVDASLELRAKEEQAQTERLEDEVRTSKRLRRLVGATGVLLVASLIAGGFAISQRSDAVDARSEAELARDEAVDARTEAEDSRDEAVDTQAELAATAFAAETARLVATSASLSERNPRVSMLLAVEAHNRQQTPETLGALQTALSRGGPLLGWLGYGNDYIDVEWVNEDRIVGARVDGIDLFDVATGELLDSVEVDVGRGLAPPTTEKFRMDVRGDLVAVIDGGDTVQLLRINEGLSPSESWTTDSTIESVLLSPVGSTVVTADVQNVVRWSTIRGEIISEVDVSDAETIIDQSLDSVGPTFIDDLLRVIPVYSLLHAQPEAVVVGTGVEVRSFSWTGEQIGGPLINVLEYAPATESVSGVWAQTVQGDETILIGADGMWSGQLPDESEQLRFTLLPSLAGGGLPDVVQIISANPTSVRTILENGAIVDIDRSTAETNVLLQLELERVSGGATAPSNDSILAIPSSGGLLLVALDGSGPIASAIPRDPLSGQLSIGRNGSFAATGGTGQFAPSTLYKQSSDGWIEDTTIQFGEEIYAGIEAFGSSDVFLHGNPGELQIAYQLTNDGPVEFFRGTTNGTSAGAVHPDLSLIVNAGYVVGVYELPDLTPVTTLRRPGTGNGSNTGAAFNADGGWFIMSNEFGESDLWDTSEWTLVDHPVVTSADIARARWSDDGRYVATVSSNGTVSLRDGESFEVIRDMIGGVGNTAWFNGTPLFSENLDLLLTTFDNTGRIWDLTTGQQIGEPITTVPSTLVGASTGQSFQLITGTETSALIWNLDMDTWSAIACKTAGSNLSEDEWRQWGPRDTERAATCPNFAFER